MSGRRKRRNRKRSERPKTPKGPQPPAVTIEETIGDDGEGVRVLEPRAVAKMNTLADYMRAGVLSQEQTDAIYKRMGLIAAKEEPRYAIPAYRVMLARAKLAYDIDRGPNPSINIDARTESGRVSVFGIAESLGLRIDIEDDGSDSGAIVEGSARRPQQEEPSGP